MNYYPQYDLNSDGIVNILDFVILVNIILADGQSRQQVQKQLDRLDSALSSDDRTKLHRHINRLQSTLQPPDNEKEKPTREILGNTSTELMVVENFIRERQRIIKLLDEFISKNNLSSVDRERVLEGRKSLTEKINPLADSKDLKESLIDKILEKYLNG
jgi:hypothetical protein